MLLPLLFADIPPETGRTPPAEATIVQAVPSSLASFPSEGDTAIASATTPWVTPDASSGPAPRPETAPFTPRGNRPPQREELPWSSASLPASRTAQPQAQPPNRDVDEAAQPSSGAADRAVDENEPALEPITEAQALRISADVQQFNQTTQVVQAEGDVRVEFTDAQLTSDILWANLTNRFVRAEGNVVYTRGDQVIAGEEATYNFAQGSGSLFGARGRLNVDDAEQDFSTEPSVRRRGQLYEPLDQRLLEPQTPSDVTNTGGITLATEGRDLPGGQGGDINRLRFESDRVDFDADGWTADEVRLTNDPFSPPELELRGDNARLTPLNENEDELVIENGRLTFDQGFSLPIVQSRFILRRGELDSDALNPLLVSVGIDGRDRDGIYIGRRFAFDTNSPWRISLTPEFYINRWLGSADSDVSNASIYGLVGRVTGPLGPRTTLSSTVSLPGLDLQNFSDRLRAKISVAQALGNHQLIADYSYRDRLFNGSLGFQDVQTNTGLTLLSPTYLLGDTQISLDYQLSTRYIVATTNRVTNEQEGLFRFQGAFNLRRRFSLWQGEPLPPTPTEGLRFTPQPVVPQFNLITGLRGSATYYSSDDFQEVLTASVGIEGIVGHFSKDVLDYTRFNLIYTKAFAGDATSPFLFDRVVDREILSGGIIQQIYGPVRAGFQTAINLETGREINTDLILEYSRRTYGFVLRYNPVQSSGYVGFRLSGFDWSGRGDEFSSPRSVEDGVISP